MAPAKNRIMSGQKNENMLASIPVLVCPRRALGNLHRAAANVALPYCPARDGLALLGHVDGREGRADEDCRHCTNVLLVLVRPQLYSSQWAVGIRRAIRNWVC